MTMILASISFGINTAYVDKLPGFVAFLPVVSANGMKYACSCSSYRRVTVFGPFPHEGIICSGTRHVCASVSDSNPSKVS